MRLLLTGFKPFDGSPINPSEQTVRALDGQAFGSLQVLTACLPVDWQRGPQALLTALEHTRPDAVLCLGEAATRPALSIERVAVNLLDFRIPDNSGAVLTDQPVIPGRPAAYFSTLPVRAIWQAIRAAGVPVHLSMSAGTYLCNQVFYTLMDWCEQAQISIPAGFIHLPRLPEQSAAMDTPCASMSLETILIGLRVAITTLQTQVESAISVD